MQYQMTPSLVKKKQLVGSTEINILGDFNSRAGKMSNSNIMGTCKEETLKENGE